MKVAFDLSGISRNVITGVGIYTTNLVNALIHSGKIEHSGTYKISRFKDRNVITSRLNVPLNVPYIPFIYNLLSHDFDVFHGPDFWLPIGGKFKKVVTVHDLAIYHEGLYSEQRRKDSIPRFENMLFKGKPDHIIVVSEFVKNEFLERFPQFAGSVTTIYHGSEHLQSKSARKPLFDFPYIAYIGTLEVRKNIRELFKGFLIANEKYPDLRLVLAGGTGGFMGKEILQEIKNHPKADKVHYLGFIDSDTAVSMISNAVALVYPSVYEGFGFPILEGMKFNVPVITSSFGAMSEIAGEAAFKVDTRKPEEIAHAIGELMEHEDLRKELMSKGIKHADSFTWAKCADETFDVYKKVL